MDFKARKLKPLLRVSSKLRDKFGLSLGDNVRIQLESGESGKYVVVKGYTKPPVMVSSPQFADFQKVKIFYFGGNSFEEDANWTGKIAFENIYKKSSKRDDVVILNPKDVRKLDTKYGKKIQIFGKEFKIIGNDWIRKLGSNAEFVLKEGFAYFPGKAWEIFGVKEDTEIQILGKGEKPVDKIESAADVTGFVGICPDCGAPLLTDLVIIQGNKVLAGVIFCARPSCTYRGEQKNFVKCEVCGNPITDLKGIVITKNKIYHKGCFYKAKEEGTIEEEDIKNLEMAIEMKKALQESDMEKKLHILSDIFKKYGEKKDSKDMDELAVLVKLKEEMKGEDVGEKAKEIPGLEDDAEELELLARIKENTFLWKMDFEKLIFVVKNIGSGEKHDFRGIVYRCLKCKSLVKLPDGNYANDAKLQCPKCGKEATLSEFEKSA